VDGKTFAIDYRTALGVLEKASKLKGFSYRLKVTDWGLFVDCIENVCTGYAGEGSGWMYYTWTKILGSMFPLDLLLTRHQLRSSATRHCNQRLERR